MPEIKEILKTACKNREILAVNHLREMNREYFGDANIVIGKNGSGKTRFLHFMADVGIKNGCRVIGLDFAESQTPDSTKQKEISGNVIFRDTIPDPILINLYAVVKKQTKVLFDNIKRVLDIREPEIRDTLDEINQRLEPLLGKSLVIKRTELYISNPETGKMDVLKSALEYLSPGEKSLLTLAIALLCVKLDQERPTLILIDEPEIHLHPAVVLQAFEMVRSLLEGTNSCIFVATHSIFLLPSFDFTEIIYMENGAVARTNGKLYQTIIDKLLYDKAEKGTLIDFFAAYDNWAYAQFMAECFLPPITVGTAQIKDPQYLKFERVISALCEKIKDRKIEVLDYGAGEGRIGQCLRIDPRADEVRQRIKYHVYNIDDPGIVFPAGYEMYGHNFTKMQELLNYPTKMDIVLLYNVLHEIDVKEWKKALNQIYQLLNKDGVLVFSERKTLSIGEDPYGESGYLLLGAQEIRILFEGMDIQQIDLDEKIRDVTIGFAIRNPKNIEITDDAVCGALKALRQRARWTIDANIKKKDHLKARDYAFYCQQFFNADHALNLLSETTAGKAYPITAS